MIKDYENQSPSIRFKSICRIGTIVDSARVFGFFLRPILRSNRPATSPIHWSMLKFCVSTARRSRLPTCVLNVQFPFYLAPKYNDFHVLSRRDQLFKSGRMRSFCLSSASSEIDELLFPSICMAAKAGDDISVDRILTISANSVHVTCKEFCRTPLHYAAQNGHHKVILNQLWPERHYQVYSKFSLDSH